MKTLDSAMDAEWQVFWQNLQNLCKNTRFFVTT